MPRPSDVVDLTFTGAYDFDASVSMAAQASFVESLREVVEAQGSRRVLDLAFVLEGSWEPVAVRVGVQGTGVRAELGANPAHASPDDVLQQLRRIFALDVDGEGFATLGATDQVVAGLQHRLPGLRPVQYPSPYECAARVIISHRLSFRTAATIAGRIAAEHGTALEVGGRVLFTFPPPQRLASLPAVPGLAERKVAQLRTLGERASDHRFTSEQLRTLPRDEAMAFLQGFPGIGPFSAELILIRGAGHPDVFPRTELSLHRAMRQAYRLPDDADVATLDKVAVRWQPYRSWVGLLLRHTVESRGLPHG